MANALLERVAPLELTERDRRIFARGWELGRSYGNQEIADAIEEVRAVPVRLPPARSWEEQVAERLGETERWYRAMLVRTGRRVWRGLDHGDDVRDYYRHGEEHATGAWLVPGKSFVDQAEHDRAAIERGLSLPALSYEDMWATLGDDVRARVRADYWDDEAARWKPGTPEIVKGDEALWRWS